MKADVRKAIAALDELRKAGKADEWKAEGKRLFQSADAEFRQAVIEYVAWVALGPTGTDTQTRKRLIDAAISDTIAEQLRAGTMDAEE